MILRLETVKQSQVEYMSSIHAIQPGCAGGRRSKKGKLDCMSLAIQRLRHVCRSNEALSEPLSDAEKAAMRGAVKRKLAELFDILLIDHAHDHNTRDTPERVAKMLVEETMRGRYSAPPEVTAFDNAERIDQLMVTGPIEVRSTCAHHMMPIYGHAFIGIVPKADGRIIGLSKYDRIVDHFCARLQIQEELVKQICRFVAEETDPAGLAVRISAVHMCKTHRGIRSSHRGRMVNTVYHGTMERDVELRNQFLQECLALERASPA